MIEVHKKQATKALVVKVGGKPEFIPIDVATGHKWSRVMPPSPELKKTNIPLEPAGPTNRPDFGRG